MTPAVCWNTPWTPQKQPPATTAVWTPSVARTSMAGAGMVTASAAAREGVAAKAAIVNAAAQSDRRLNGLRDMAFLFGLGGLGSSLRRRSRFAIGASCL